MENMELLYYKEKMKYFKSKIIDNSNEEEVCPLCGSLKDLVEDDHNEGVFYCMECLERSLKHDEMIYEGYEESPDVGD